MDKTEFLKAHGWDDAQHVAIAGDASSRSYTRLSDAERTAILMDAGSGSNLELATFTNVARALSAQGLSAPEILADGGDRFLLLEDLGDDTIARVCLERPADELPLYLAATDALLAMQSLVPPEGFLRYGSEEMTAATALVFEWFPTPKAVYSEADQSEILRIFADKLARFLPAEDVMIHRDFHAENLLWLPDRKIPASIGLLDFQDAVRGPSAYDLASLLMDARRDVSNGTRDACLKRFAEETQTPMPELARQVAICSAQRNVRILGIFARLAYRDGKPHYLELIPRVWDNLMRDLSHPELGDLRAAIMRVLPSPDTMGSRDG